MNFLNANRQIGLVSGRALTIDTNGRELPQTYLDIVDPDFIKWLLLFTCPINHPASMGRRELVLKAGKYDPLVNHAEDYDLWQRMSRITLLTNLRDVLIKKRVHSSSLGSSQPQKMMTDHMLVQQRAISALLESPVDFEQIKGLRNLSQTVSPRESINLIKQCQKTFFEKNELEPRVKLLVRQDAAFRIYRVANFNRSQPAYWWDLLKSFVVNPSLLHRVFRAIERRLGS